VTVGFRNDRNKAALFALAAVAVASMQDAVVKQLSAEFSISQTVFIRAIVAVAILSPWMMAQRISFSPGNISLIILRSLILCCAYFCFVLSIAALPIATSVSIYFTMPFFVAALAGWSLGEKVKAYRWLAIAAGFVGVLIMVRPGSETFEPAALLALASAFGYAVGQLFSRHVSQTAAPVVITNWQSIVYGIVALLLSVIAPVFADQIGDSKVLGFLLRAWKWPDATQSGLLVLTGVLATFGSLFFVQAYRHAEANFVAPFEYSGLLWAVVNGMVFFGDIPDRYTWAGAAVVVGAGIWMLRRDRLNQ
jgi:drug/metabolite transporter (DMT)-like permease